MKRLFYFFLILSLALSGCVLSLQSLSPITVHSAIHLDDGFLSIVLENALQNYRVVVNGSEFPCEFRESDPELLECIGPDIEPGEEILIEIYQGNGGEGLVAKLAGTLPDYQPDLGDSDADGVADSEDECPLDPEKSAPGECGCGVPDEDSDGDGTLDCDETCPDGISDGVGDPCDHDEDGDGVDDFQDKCPFDSNKTELGACGCGGEDTDTDHDGTPDCEDKCPEDPEKTKPGVCGCGVSNTDSDGDDVLDCVDECPEDWGPKSNGGCPIEDSDEDGIPDHEDECPTEWGPESNDGCPIEDSDGDGTPDHEDGCPEDPEKIEPGACGCGVADTDSDGDDFPDCEDECPTEPGEVNGCPDSDEDGVMDCEDACPFEWGSLPNGCPEPTPDD